MARQIRATETVATKTLDTRIVSHAVAFAEQEAMACPLKIFPFRLLGGQLFVKLLRGLQVLPLRLFHLRIGLQVQRANSSSKTFFTSLDLV